MASTTFASAQFILMEWNFNSVAKSKKIQNSLRNYANKFAMIAINLTEDEIYKLITLYPTHPILIIYCIAQSKKILNIK